MALNGAEWKRLELAESGRKGWGRDTRMFFEGGGKKRFRVGGRESIPFGRDEKSARISAEISACTMPDLCLQCGDVPKKTYVI